MPHPDWRTLLISSLILKGPRSGAFSPQIDRDLKPNISILSHNEPSQSPTETETSPEST